MNKRLMVSIRFSFLFMFAIAAVSVSAQDNYVVSAGAAGPVRIGMTVEEARKAMPNHTFGRTSDGEGVALIEVKNGSNVIFTLYAGEEDAEKSVDYGKVIEQIEIWSPSYKTKEGIGPNVTIDEAQKKYGALKEIMLSEIESRQYAEFENGPKGITFRIDYTGIFPEGERTTTKYEKGAKVYSLLIQGDGTESNVGFSSEYTDLEKDCKTPEGQGDESGHVLIYCDGFENYRVHMYDTAMTFEITVEATDARKSVSVARESLDFSPRGKKLEWRYKYGVPFAVIFRGNKYKLNENGQIKYPAEITGEYLFVRGLPGFESINADVDLRTTKFANEEARKIAGEGYVRVMFPAKDYLNLDTSDYNLKIITAANRNESWVKSPMQVSFNIAGEFSEMKTRKMDFEAPTGEGADSFTLTVVNEGLLDDSVRGEKYVFVLVRETTGIWKVSSAKKAWRCWPGRGHEDFSAVRCV